MAYCFCGSGNYCEYDGSRNPGFIPIDHRPDASASRRVRLRGRIYRDLRLEPEDPHMQLRELREYCQRRGMEIAGEYVDAGVSGAKERRPQLDALLAACRKRLVDAVVVYRYDRFARSLRQLVNALEEFRSLGIEFISLHEGVDTSTPNGRLIFGIFASIAEFERELIRHALNGSGELSLTELKKRVKVKSPVFDCPIGWLARENKIVITLEKRSFRVRLREQKSKSAGVS